MFIVPDTFSVTDFRENTSGHIRRLKKSKKPTLLTQNGRAAAVVLSPDAYEQLAADAELAISGQSVYRLIAADAILQMIGHSLVLECEGPWVLASPAARAAPAVPPGRVSAASGGESPADRRAAA